MENEVQQKAEPQEEMVFKDEVNQINEIKNPVKEEKEEEPKHEERVETVEDQRNTSIRFVNDILNTQQSKRKIDIELENAAFSKLDEPTHLAQNLTVKPTKDNINASKKEPVSNVNNNIDLNKKKEEVKKIESKIESKIDAKFESKLESKTYSKVDAKSESLIKDSSSIKKDINSSVVKENNSVANKQIGKPPGQVLITHEDDEIKNYIISLENKNKDEKQLKKDYDKNDLKKLEDSINDNENNNYDVLDEIFSNEIAKEREEEQKNIEVSIKKQPDSLKKVYIGSNDFKIKNVHTNKSQVSNYKKEEVISNKVSAKKLKILNKNKIQDERLVKESIEKSKSPGKTKPNFFNIKNQYDFQQNDIVTPLQKFNQTGQLYKKENKKSTDKSKNISKTKKGFEEKSSKNVKLKLKYR